MFSILAAAILIFFAVFMHWKTAKHVTGHNFLFFSHRPSYLNGWDRFLISIHSSVVLLLYPRSVCTGLLCTIQSLLEALLTFWRVIVWDEKGCEWHCCNCFKLKRNILTSCDCVDSCFFLSCLKRNRLSMFWCSLFSYSLWSRLVFYLNLHREQRGFWESWLLVALLWMGGKKIPKPWVNIKHGKNRK